ncbi:mitochondrion organization and biogenesis protein [Colletotrichum truncatum]|uniref:Mitochondrion organization and biogenesis protein n=1 Tax=Colletotrichum truncatum TaxID=5467 RepID=A0ACC3ZAB6_COLTU|nr:mitochondrion organization and biogenesis protein [Colletotrichum truncatum]KAF6796196.1 mitochondrion organization and biogenesis protein [Colletotrichum truncatum]
MLCSCRLSPLRLFIKGMSQLHISEPAVARLPQRISSNATTFQIGPKSPFTTTSRRKQSDSPPEGKRGREYKEKVTFRDQTAARRTQKPGGISFSKTPRNEDEDGNFSFGEKRNKEQWQIQKAALKEKFPEGWNPRKRLSPDAIAGIKALNSQFPEEYTTTKLAAMFEVSPESIRRILRSKWQASPEEEEKRQERWFRRGVSVWSRYAELGMKPPRKWRREGVARDPSYHDNRKAAIERRKEEEAAEDKGEKLQRRLGDSIM